MLDCIICNSTSNEEKTCLSKKRNIIYETYCSICYKDEIYEIEKKDMEKSVIKKCDTENSKLDAHENSLDEKKKKRG